VGDLTLDDSVAAMAERILDSAPGRFGLCGLSLGGYVAFEIMRRAPERVERLALMSTSARPDTTERAVQRSRSVEAARIGTFKGVTPRYLPGIVHPAHAADPGIADTVLQMTERVGRMAFERQQWAALSRPDSREILPMIDCPTLVVGGREDRVAPPILQEEIAAGIAGARLCILGTCGHLAPLEQPAEVNRLLQEWLS